MSELTTSLPLLIALAVGSLLAFCGLLLMVVGWCTLRDSLGQSGWVRVPAEILSSSVEERSLDETRRFAPKVVYRFPVGGGLVTASRLRLAERVYPSEAAARRRLGAYPVGGTVMARYPDGRPADAVLESGGGGAGALVLVLGLAMLVGPLWAAEAAGLPGRKMGAGVAGVVGLLWLSSLRWRQREARARRDGLLPPPGCGSDADVHRLLGLGEKLLAIRLYRQLHGTDLKSAREAVERLADRPGAAD